MSEININAMKRVMAEMTGYDLNDDEDCDEFEEDWECFLDIMKENDMKP